MKPGTDIPSIPEERLSDERLNELVVDDVSAITASWLELQKIARELQSRRSPNEAGGRGEDSSTAGAVPLPSWQPISTAPKDRFVWVRVRWINGTKRHVGRWADEQRTWMALNEDGVRYPAIRLVDGWFDMAQPPPVDAINSLPLPKAPTPVSVRHDKEEE